MAASDLRPTWTITWESRMSITMPVNKLPGFMVTVLKFLSSNSSKFKDIFMLQT